MRSWGRWPLGIVCVTSLLLGTVTLMPGALAVFNDAPAVPNSVLQAKVTFGGTRFASGAHTGNAVDNRALTGVGFSPDLVIVKGSTTQIAQARTSTMAGDVTKPLTGATAITAGSNRIQSLAADGLTLGTNAAVNGNTIAYYWAAVDAVAGSVVVGSYTGNGGAQAIAGFGFSPEYVIVMSAAANRPVQRSSTMPTTYRFDNTAATANGITSLDANGFSVGNSAEANANGIVHHYVAWNAAPGLMAASSYTGATGDNRSITGAGFAPEYVIVKSATATTEPTHRVDSVAGDSTLRFVSGANVANRIQALQPDGFQVGTDATVNTNGIVYHYVVFNDP